MGFIKLNAIDGLSGGINVNLKGDCVWSLSPWWN